MYTMIDLFSGCGGFSAGFVCFDEHPRWRVLLGIDIDEDAVNTFNNNFGEGICKVANLEKVRPTRFMRSLNLVAGELDYLHASPPCNSYTVNNRKNSNHGDTRYKIALTWTRVFAPKVLTIENVHELGKVHDKQIRSSLIQLGYRVYRFSLDAADFGVPQHRKRLFYLAYRRALGIRRFRLITTHVDPEDRRNAHLPWVSAKEAISDLPPRTHGHGPDSFVSNIQPDSRRLSEYARTMRPHRGERITEHYARPLDALALNRLQHLAPGEAIEHLPADIRPRNGFRGAYGRLHPDRPSKTITTGIRGPSHGPFCHYNQERVITFREAARLQSFPDSFIFTGSRSSKSTQIGNAVPPLLANVFCDIAEQILSGRPRDNKLTFASIPYNSFNSGCNSVSVP